MSDLKEYKCPACGGAIEFDSRSQKMKCPYCDTEFDLDTLKLMRNSSVKKRKERLLLWNGRQMQAASGRKARLRE